MKNNNTDDSILSLNISETDGEQTSKFKGESDPDLNIGEIHKTSGLFQSFTKRQKLFTIGLITLLTIGALGAGTNLLDTKDGSWLSTIAEKVGIKEKSVNVASRQLVLPTGTLQLSKEYIYAGSRMLATEDYGIATANPTPTPSTGGGPTPTPNESPTPTLTPTPTPDPVTGCPSGFASLGGVINSDPTTSVFAGNIYVFARGTDGALYYQYSNGGTFTGWIGMGGILTSNPASTSNATNLFVEATGTDNNRYYQTTTNGINFSGWIGGNVTTMTNPSAVFNGQTYTFVKGTGSNPHLCIKVTSGGATPTPTSTLTPTPTPEVGCYVTANQMSTYTLQVNWTASPSRPANTDKIQIVQQSNPSFVIYEEFTNGGTSNGYSISPMPFGPDNYTIRYMQGGTIERCSNNFTVEP